MKWFVQAPRDLGKTLRRLPIEVGKIFESLSTDFEKEGPFPQGWHVEPLHGRWEGYFKAKLKREYRVIYKYEPTNAIISIEKVAHRKEVYRR